MKLQLLPRSRLQLKTLPRFPVGIAGAGGNSVVNVGGVYTVRWTPSAAGFSDFSMMLAAAPNAAAALGYLGAVPLAGGTMTGLLVLSANPAAALGAATKQYVDNFPLGALNNVRLAKTGAYAVANADKRKTVALGGAAFYTLTFNAASGYDADFAAVIVNEDAGRAKWIAVNGGTNFYLWPGQSVIVLNQNNTWRVLGRSRWKLPAALTINTDFTNGSDTAGATDGLATGAAAFKTLRDALLLSIDQFDWDATWDNHTVLTFKMAAGVTDTTQAHFGSISGVPAGFGGQSITIDGNGGTLNCASDSSLQLYYGATVTIQNLTIGSGGGHGMEVNWGARCFLGAGIVFTSAIAAKAHIFVSDGARLEIDNGYTISSAAAGQYHIYNRAGNIRTNGTVTIASNLALAYMMLGQDPGSSDLSGLTWSLGGHTVTTTNSYNIAANHVLYGSASIPGSGGGLSASGGQAL